MNFPSQLHHQYISHQLILGLEGNLLGGLGQGPDGQTSRRSHGGAQTHVHGSTGFACSGVGQTKGSLCDPLSSGGADDRVQGVDGGQEDLCV